MIYKKRISCLYNVCIMILILGSCISSPTPPREQPALTLSPSGVFPTSQVPSLSPKPSKNVMVTPTFIPSVPTVLPIQQTRMIELLHFNDCKLPCYLGITPGKTSWNDAKDILDSIGGSLRGDYMEDNLPVNSYTLWIGDPTLIENSPDPNIGIGANEIAQSIDLTIKDEKVQRIKVYIQTRNFSRKFYEYWSLYSLHKIFLQYGSPDAIYFGISQFGNGYIFFLVYETLGSVIRFNGVKRGDLICPGVQEENVTTGLNLTLTSTSSHLNLFDPQKVYPTNHDVYLSVKEALGIDKMEFYNKVSSNISVCFKAKAINP